MCADRKTRDRRLPAKFAKYAPASLANSFRIFLGDSAHYDMARIVGRQRVLAVPITHQLVEESPHVQRTKF